VYLGDRNGSAHADLQWSSDKNAEFSGFRPGAICPFIRDPEKHYERSTWKSQGDAAQSLGGGEAMLWRCANIPGPSGRRHGSISKNPRTGKSSIREPLRTYETILVMRQSIPVPARELDACVPPSVVLVGQFDSRSELFGTHRIPAHLGRP